MTESTLHIVDTTTGEVSAEPYSGPWRPIPAYEGKEVASTRLRVGSTAAIDISDAVLKVDDIVRIVVEARVTSVNHVVNEKTGELVRIQSVKSIDAEITPWAADGDEGVTG